MGRGRRKCFFARPASTAVAIFIATSALSTWAPTFFSMSGLGPVAALREHEQFVEEEFSTEAAAAAEHLQDQHRHQLSSGNHLRAAGAVGGFTSSSTSSSISENKAQQDIPIRHLHALTLTPDGRSSTSSSFLATEAENENEQNDGNLLSATSDNGGSKFEEQVGDDHEHHEHDKPRSSTSPSLPSWVKDTAKDTVESAIQKNKLVMFSKAWCPYCKKAKKALQNALKEAGSHTQLTVIELEDENHQSPLLVGTSSTTKFSASDVQSELQSLVGSRTVPKVFLDGRFLGGGDEIVAMYTSGALKHFLQDNGGLLKGTATETIDSVIRENNLVLFSMGWCPFCQRAKEVLRGSVLHGDIPKLVVIDIQDKDSKSLVEPLDVNDFMNYLAEITGRGTNVPKVFLDGHLLKGEHDEVSVDKLDKTGELKDILRSSECQTCNDDK